MQVTWVWLFWSELPGLPWRVCALVRLPFRMVLSCETGTREGKPQVEQYGLDELAASAEAVVSGLGPLAAGLAGLAVEAGRAVTLDAMEVLVAERAGSCCAGWSSWRWTGRLSGRCGCRR